MRLKEYQGKALFREFGIKTPKGVLIRNFNDLNKVKFNDCIVKAQILEGQRGKRGLIKSCKKRSLKKIVKEFLTKGIKEILVEPKIKIHKELYLSITINRAKKCLTILYSELGGIDIEEASEKDPNKFIQINLYSWNTRYIKHRLKNSNLLHLSFKLYKLMKKYQATLVEINPLVLSGRNYLAVDSKIIIDDNALYKFPEIDNFAQASLTPVEKDAKKHNLQYVELKGNIAVIGNGAGLVMSTLDVLNHFKGRAANFLDVGGGANIEKMEKALEIVLEKKTVKGIFINIFGGITRCDDIAQGIIDYTHKHKIIVPIVVRMIGTNEKQGKKLLKKEKIHAIDSMELGAKKIVKLVQP